MYQARQLNSLRSSIKQQAVRHPFLTIPFLTHYRSITGPALLLVALVRLRSSCGKTARLATKPAFFLFSCPSLGHRYIPGREARQSGRYLDRAFLALVKSISLTWILALAALASLALHWHHYSSIGGIGTVGRLYQQRPRAWVWLSGSVCYLASLVCD